ncbi:MAG TPA: hypothetical protein VIL18_05660 [Longimicrobiales bacterium]
MRALSRLLGSIALLCCLPPALSAQQEVEPYQMFGAAFGWGAIGPGQDTGIPGDAADAGTSMQFGLELEIRQNSLVYLYGRADADAADVRQHLGLSGGVRMRPFRGRPIRPVAGFGIGFYWLEPKVDATLAVEREIALRAEGHIGAEWLAVPGLRWYVEYRLAASRYPAVVRQEGCTPPDRCLALSGDRLLHLAHTGWVGVRIKMF